MDYEYIPFWYKRCHEYGHLYRQCPLNKIEESIDKKEEERILAEDPGREEKGLK